MAAMKGWENLGGGWARIDIYRHDLGGAYYLAKGNNVEVGPVWFDR
jgi:hypothetical protein